MVKLIKNDIITQLYFILYILPGYTFCAFIRFEMTKYWDILLIFILNGYFYYQKECIFIVIFWKYINSFAQ